MFSDHFSQIHSEIDAYVSNPNAVVDRWIPLEIFPQLLESLQAMFTRHGDIIVCIRFSFGFAETVTFSKLMINIQVNIIL